MKENLPTSKGHIVNCFVGPKNYALTSLFKTLLIALFLVLFNPLNATVHLSPSVNNGGFESGSTGWTLLNSTYNASANPNAWIASTAVFNSGTRSMFISNNGSANQYSTSASPAQTSHFYRDIVIPAGESIITLNFWWKSRGEAGAADALSVYAITTATAFSATVNSSGPGAVPGTGFRVSGPHYNVTTWQNTGNITLPASFAGTTLRLLFSWRSDGSAGTQPPAAVDDITLTSISPCTTPAAPTAVTPSSPSTICQGTNINLNATSAGNTINWYTTATGGTPIGSSASGANFVYAVTGTTNYYAEAVNGSCLSATRTATALITVTPLPGQPGAFNPGPASLCVGTSATYTAPAASNVTSYDWNYSGSGATLTANTASPSQSISFSTAATNGTLSITGKNGCGTGTPRTQAITINPSFIANAGADKVVPCSGAGVALSGSYTLSTGGSCPGSTLFSENFEACTNNVLLTSVQCGWTQLNVTGSGNTNSWGLSTTGGITSRSLTIYNGSAYGNYSNTANGNRIAYYGTKINATGYSALLLNFKWKCNGEYSNSTYWDYGMVVWSLDGVTWNDVSATKYNVQTGGSGTVSNLSLAAANGTQFYIGFRWVQDNSTGSGPFTVDDISITGTNWCSAGPTIAWSNGSNSLTPTVTTPNTYTLSVTAGNGCVTTDQAVTTTPSAPTTPTAVTPSSPVTQCQGTTVNLNATSAGNTISWYTAASGGTAVGSSASGANYVLTLTTSNTYYAEAVNGVCVSTSRTPTAAITVNPLPGQPGAYSSAPASVCATNTATYTAGAATNATSYDWTYSGAGVTLTANTASPTQLVTFTSAAANGTISIKGKNTCGTGTARTQAVTITRSLVASAGGDKVINCTGVPLTLDGSYTLSTGGSCPSQTIYSETFEGLTTASPGGWVLGADASGTNPNRWSIIAGGTGANTPITDSRSLRVMQANETNFSYTKTNAADILARSPQINAVGYTGLTLTFKWKSMAEDRTSSGANIPFDYGRAGYSTDGSTITYFANGGNTNTASNANSGENTGYYYFNAATQTQTYTLPAGLNNTTFYLHFSWFNDASAGTDPAFTVDDISITGTNWCHNPTIAWSSGPAPSNSLTPTVAAAGNYTLSVTTSNGCVTTDQVSVTNPAAPVNPGNPTSNSPQCANVGTTLTRAGSPPAGETWYWQTSASGTDLANSGTTFNATASGTYYIRSRNNTTQCWSPGAGSLAVVVNAMPTVSIAPVTATVCNGQSVQLTASGITSYSWSPNTLISCLSCSNPNVTPTASLTYTVTGTDANGCSGTASRLVSVGTLPNAPTPVTPATTSICTGSSINLNATSAGNTINWYTVASAGTAVTTGVASGANFAVSPGSNTTYYAEAQTTLGCKSATRTATGLISIVALPSAPGATGGYSCGPGTITLNASGAGGAENYKWYSALTGGSLLQTNGASYNTSSNGTYYVVKYQTAAPNCESSPRTPVVATIYSTTGAGLDAYGTARNTGITYTDISGTGTAVTSWRNGTDRSDNMSTALALPSGFVFPYDGGRPTEFLVSTNGFITFNTATKADGGDLFNAAFCSNSTEPYTYDNERFSNAVGKGGTLQAIAPFYNDLYCQNNALNASVHYLSTGASPNRVFTVQWRVINDWSNHTDCSYSSGALNFQVKLYETSGNIEFVYGGMTQTSFSCSSGSASVYNTYTAGINSSTLTASPTTAQLFVQQAPNDATFGATPQNGLTTLPASNSRILLTRTAPGAPATVPLCISYNYPANGASNQCLNSTLSWSPVDGNPTGYDVYFNDFNPPTTVVASNQGGTYYSPTIAANKTYYWKVIARNAIGAATSAPVYSFSTLTGDVLNSVTSNIGNTFCAGSTATLTANGSLSQGSSFRWESPFILDIGCHLNNFAEQCSGSTLTRTFNTPGNYSYYVFTRGCNGNTACKKITLTVLDNDNTDPTSIASSMGNAICLTGSTMLTAAGGTHGPGAQYEWHTGSCTGPVIATTTSASITVTPTGNTTYFVRRIGGNTCPNGTGCASLAITSTARPAAPTANGGNPTVCPNNAPGWVAAQVPSGFTVDWYSAATTGTLLLSNSGNYAPPSGGNYYAQSRDWATGCTSATRTLFTYTISPTPAAPTSGGNVAVCTNALPGILTATPPAGSTVDWHSASTGSAGIVYDNNTFSTSTPGTYYAQSRNTTTGCISTTLVPVTLSTTAIPAIGTQPTAPAAICAGAGTVTLSVTASGAGLSFQWKKNGTTNINAGGVFGVVSNATSSTLTLTNPPASEAGNYTVVVSGTCSPPVTSNSVTVTINSPPSIGTQPTVQAACVGGSAIFSVGATGTGLSYQWKKGGSTNVGTNSPSLTINPVSAGDADNYSVVVSGTCSPPATSNPVALTVNSSPSISAHPSSPAPVCEGNGTRTISVTASGTGLSFQWRKGVSNISSTGIYSIVSTATGSTVTITNPATTDAGNYDVVISGSCGSPVTSNAAVLTVHQSITGLNASAGTNPLCDGETLNLFATVTTGTGITWGWTGPTAFSSALQNPSRLNIHEVIAPVGEGSYTVSASNACTPVTPLTSAVAVNVQRPIPALSTPSFSANPICVGENLSITVTYDNSAVTASDIQWGWSGPNGFNPAVQNPGITGVTTAASGDYVLVASNACPSQTAFSPTLIVTPPPTTANAGPPQSICGGTLATLAANAPTAGTGLWSIVNGTGGNIADNTDNVSTFTGTTGTTYTLRWTISNAPCTPNSTSDVVIAFPNNPSVTASNTGPFPFGSTIQLNASPNGFADYSWSGPGGFSAVGVQNPTISGAASGNAGIYTVTVTDANNCSGTANTDVIISGIIVWQGHTADWHTAANWIPATVPNSCSAKVLIPSSPVGGNPPTVFTAVSVGDIEVQDDIRVTLNANLNVCGTWTGGGVFPSAIIGVQSVVFTGSTQQTLEGRTQFTKLHINNPSGAKMQPASRFDIIEALELGHGNFDATDGRLRFLSPSSTQVGIINDFGAGFDGTLTGSITAQRGYDAPVTANSFSQHFMGSPVNAPAFAQFGASGTPGFIKALPNCYVDQQAPGSPFGTMFEHDEAHGAGCGMESWKSVVAGNAQNGKGYSVAKPGAGTLSLQGEANLDTAYTISGLNNSNWGNQATYLRTAPFNTVTINSGWHLVSNPYLAYLDLQAHAANGEFGAQAQVWETTGPFAGSYQPRMAGSGGALIAPFQGFMVRKLSTATPAASYTLFGTDRTTRDTAFYRQADDHALRIFAEDPGTGKLDVTAVAFNTAASMRFDAGYDANKLMGDGGRQTLYTLGAGGEKLSINTNYSTDETPSIPLSMQPGVAGTYRLKIEGVNSFDATSYIYLEDKTTGQWTDLRQNPNYAFAMGPGESIDRFVLHFTPPVDIATLDALCGAPGEINIAQPGTATWRYKLTSAATQTLVASGALNQSMPVHASVEPGLYTLALADNSNYTVVRHIQVGGAQSVTGGFTASTQSPQAMQDIAFNSDAANAVQYEWEFSDGTVITGVANPVYAFIEPGTYTVTLTVVTEDGCISSSTQTITVAGQSATGLSNINVDTAIKIWGSKNKVHVDFAQMKQVNATIEIYNVLGQRVCNDKFGTSTIYTKELNQFEAAYVFVKVVNNGNVITKKVLVTDK